MVGAAPREGIFITFYLSAHPQRSVAPLLEQPLPEVPDECSHSDRLHICSVANVADAIHSHSEVLFFARTTLERENAAQQLGEFKNITLLSLLEKTD